MAIRYGQGVHDLDLAFGLLVTGVEAALESPVWLAVSDHGESLHEHLETRGYGYDHGEFLDDEQIRIALFLAGPDIATGRVRTAVSIRDVYTTLLGVAGIADAEAASAGRLDLRSLAPGESGPRWVRASRRALRKGEAAALGSKAALVRAHRVVATDGTRAVILGEDGRILRTQRETDPEGLAVARAHLASARGAVADASRHELDEETRAELEALGYVR
jgi:arylsulfatase A-like enzyme